MRASLRLLAAVLLLVWSRGISADDRVPARHDKEFWRAIAASEYAVPEGESAIALLRELSGLLGSPDPEERDTFGYGIAARWIYVQKLLSAEELHELRRAWSGNLRTGLGDTGNDSVLLRSFSALNLSILAAHDNRSPWLGEEGFRELLGATLSYLADERDVRGYVPEKGWLHSAAHTADLIKFLARSRHLEVPDQARILDAVASKMEAPGGIVYRHGEDERLARAVLSILRREDLDREAVERWLQGFGAMTEGLWDGPLDTRRYAAVQNAKNLLKSLYVLLSVEDPDDPPSEAVLAVRALVLKTVAGM